MFGVFPLESLKTSRIARIIAMLAFATVLSGCEIFPMTLIGPPDNWVPESSRVLLMPVDARTHVRTAGGTVEERADWTQLSRAYLRMTLEDALLERGVEVVRYREFGEVTPWNPEHAPLVRLYDVVGASIQDAWTNLLPTKPRSGYQISNADYSLGETVLELSDSYSARYALLLNVNSIYATGGRWAVAVLAAVGGVPMSVDSVTSHAALVDLNDGEIIWFVRDILGGDTRTHSGARELAERVLEELPL